MNELLLKYYNGELSPAEKQQLFTLINEDKEMKKEFFQLQSLKTFMMSLPMENDKIKAEEYLKHFKLKQRKKRILILSKQIINYVAVILIVVIFTWFLKSTVQDNTQVADVEYQDFITPAGQRALLKLQDGTSVWLNAQTTLRYPISFSRSERRVELDGEAFFEVQPNQKIPFIVSTEKVDIQVHGTSFNVFAYKGYDEFRTALTEGSIELSNRKEETQRMMLSSNEYVEFINGQFIKSHLRNTDFLLWKEGIYAFEDESFSEILKRLQLYYDITIEADNEELLVYKFSAKFRQRDGIESVLSKLSKIYYFRFKKDEQRNVITIY